MPTMDNIYDDAAGLGTTISFISLIVGCIIAIILFIIGGVAIFSSTDNQWSSVTGTVQSAICEPTTTSTTSSNTTTTSTSYNCTLKITYTVAGVTYSDKTLSLTSTSLLEKDSSVTFQYKISDPNITRQSQAASALVGGILFGVGAFIILVSGLQYYLARKSKLFAGATAVGAVAHIFH